MTKKPTARKRKPPSPPPPPPPPSPRRAVAKRPPTTVTPTRGEVVAVQKLFDRIPDDELREALMLSDDPRAARLLAVIDDATGAYATSGMAVRIRAAGWSVTGVLKEITTMYRGDADLRVARRLPQIMEQMAVEADVHEVPCPDCHGERRLGSDATFAKRVGAQFRNEPPPMTEACNRCNGFGTVFIEADNDVRKMILEAQGVLGRGPLVDARSIHFGGRGGAPPDAGAPDMTEWSRNTDAVFDSPTRPQLPAASDIPEAEIVSTKEE